MHFGKKNEEKKKLHFYASKMNRFYYIFCLSISLKVIENLTKGHPVFFFKCIVITTIRRVDIIIIDSFRKFEVLINLDVLQRNQKTALHNINNQNTIHVCNKNMKSQIKCKAEFSTNETERKKKKKTRKQNRDSIPFSNSTL